MTADTPSFTEEVRQELGRLPPGPPSAQRAELAALLRLAGALHLTGAAHDPDRIRLQVETASGAVARRVHLLLGRRYELRPELSVRRASGVRRHASYGLALAHGSDWVARDLDLIDGAGRPVTTLDHRLVGTRGAAEAYLRGAVLASGSLSTPGRPPHLEIAVTSPAVASALADVASEVAGSHLGVVASDRGSRLVAKSGDAIGALLAAIGAPTAFLRWEEHRLRRSLRGEANRLANADAANLRRSVEAAAAQIAAVEGAIERVGWSGLDDDLRAVALARMANPSASLAELGQLCDPPLHKSAVYRRLQRLEALQVDEP